MNPTKQSRKLFRSCTREVNEKKDLNEFQELLRTGTGVESVGKSGGNVAKIFAERCMQENSHGISVVLRQTSFATVFVQSGT